MKKFFVCLLVLVMVVTMISCNAIPKSPAYVQTYSEKVIIDECLVGYVDCYGEYYCFESTYKSGYLIFLDYMDEKIDIISINMTDAKNSSERYIVTYKLIEEN